MRKDPLSCSPQRPVIPLFCAPPDVHSSQPGNGKITQWLPANFVPRPGPGFCHTSQGGIPSGVRHVAPPQVNSFTDLAPVDSPNGIMYRISTRSHPYFESRRSTSCRLSDLGCSRPFGAHTRRLSRDSHQPTPSERKSLAGSLLIRMKSSTSSSSRSLRLRYQWHTTWLLGGD